MTKAGSGSVSDRGLVSHMWLQERSWKPSFFSGGGIPKVLMEPPPLLPARSSRPPPPFVACLDLLFSEWRGLPPITRCERDHIWQQEVGFVPVGHPSFFVLLPSHFDL